jgi:hypothetical protein
MISVFTPLSASGNRYIQATWETLKSQTLGEFEWVVLENHGGSLPKKIRKDPRVKVYGDTVLEGIGALKRRCCELATGDFFLELDHDDLLHDTALEKAVAALEHADFAYSDTAEFHDETWVPNTYRTDCGWSSYPVTFQGHELLAQPQPPATPHNLRLIDWSPNHFRAWRKDAYWKVDGHNPNLPVIDDHDLIVRMYLADLIFKHIPECLYFYRVHPQNTVGTKNALIRSLTQEVYDRNIFALAERFCTHVECQGDDCRRMWPLKKIDLCGGIDTAPGYEPLDLSLGHDLNHRWPLDDHSVGVLRAYDAIEHLTSPIHTMNEAYRVLAPGGFFFIRVPSTDGRGAFQDPTHVSFWNENSFWYYTKHSHARYVPGLQARFQLTRLRTFYPNPGMEEARIPFVEAHLIALKDGYSPMGLVEM